MRVWLGRYRWRRWWGLRRVGEGGGRPWLGMAMAFEGVEQDDTSGR